MRAAGWAPGKNLLVKQYWMDTYRTNATPEAMQQQGQIALAEIAEFKPDIVFVLVDSDILVLCARATSNRSSACA